MWDIRYRFVAHNVKVVATPEGLAWCNFDSQLVLRIAELLILPLLLPVAKGFEITALRITIVNSTVTQSREESLFGLDEFSHFPLGTVG